MTLASILAQIAAPIFVIGNYFAAEWSRDRSQRRILVDYARAEAI